MSSNCIYSVYLITNLINNKTYVGMSKDYEKRWNRHKKGVLSAPTEVNLAIHYAIKKYGVSNFDFKVIYQTKDFEDIVTKESYFIEEFESRKYGYNRHPGGNNRVWSEEEKRLLGNNRLGPNNPNWKSGKGPKKGHLEGTIRPKQSDVMKSQPRLNGKIAPHPPILIDNVIYSTLKEAIEKTGFSYYYIHTRIKNGTFKIVK